MWLYRNDVKKTLCAAGDFYGQNIDNQTSVRLHKSRKVILKQQFFIFVKCIAWLDRLNFDSCVLFVKDYFTQINGIMCDQTTVTWLRVEFSANMRFHDFEFKVHVLSLNSWGGNYKFRSLISLILKLMISQNYMLNSPNPWQESNMKGQREN